MIEEISRLHNIKSVGELLLIVLVQEYNEKQQLGRKKYKMLSLERKGILGDLKFQPRHVVGERQRLLGRSATLKKGQVCNGTQEKVLPR